MGNSGGLWLKRMPHAPDFAKEKIFYKHDFIKKYKTDKSIKDKLTDNLS